MRDVCCSRSFELWILKLCCAESWDMRANYGCAEPNRPCDAFPPDLPLSFEISKAVAGA